jgi:signal transduction histidine kinase
MNKPEKLVLAVAAAAAAATAVVALVPSLRFAYHAPEVRVGLETCAALIALTVAYLALGRFLRARHLDSLLLATGLGVISLSNLLAAVLLAFPTTDLGRLSVNGANAVGAGLLAAAGFARSRPLARHRREPLALLAAVAALLAVAFGVLFAIDQIVGPVAVEARSSARHPAFENDPGLLAAQIAALAAFLLAAIGFARRADREGDTFYSFVAVGVTLGAVARLNYILFAPSQGGLVRTGDVFRALFYIVLLVGAGREIEGYWRRLAQTAVLEERRRIARDLHDGVAQELAFIGRRAKRLAARSDDDSAREIAASAERALGDSRRAIAALTKPLDVPLADVLAEAVEEVAARYDVKLALDFARGVEVDADRREALVRIACEAVANAARHGGADVVRVALSNANGVRFAVHDDGVGFRPDQPVAGRFGIAIMRERAQAVGGSFDLRSSPGSGTRVEVVLP